MINHLHGRIHTDISFVTSLVNLKSLFLMASHQFPFLTGSATSFANIVLKKLNFMAISVGPHPDTDNIMDPKPAEGEEQAKKRRGRKKSKLEDMFPAYLQVCNFPMSHALKQFLNSQLPVV